MKWITALFGMLISLVANAQNYTLPLNSRFLDLPGPSFLMTYSEGAQIFIKEIDENLGELWADSITMSPYSDSIYISNIVQFGSMDNYLLTAKRVISTNYPSPSYLWTSPYDWDVKLSTFSIQNQGFTASIRDSFNMIGSLIKMPYSDDQIYLMSKQTMMCNFVPQYQLSPFTISSNLTYGTLPSMVNCAPKTNSRINIYDGDIQWFFIHQDNMKMMYFDSLLNYQGSVWESVPTTIASSWPNAFHAYSNRLSRDSILSVLEWTAAGGGKYWQSNLFSEDLHTISSIEVLPPIAPNGDDYDMHRVIKVGEHLYILGTEAVPGVDHWTVFKYDLDMNLQCEISATPWAVLNTASSKSMRVLNDKAYFTITDAYSEYAYEVDCGTNSLSSATKVKDFKIYPNPASTKLTIDYSGMSKVLHLSVVDLNGQTVIVLENDAEEVDVSKLESGMYLLKVKFEGGTVGVERFVKN